MTIDQHTQTRLPRQRGVKRARAGQPTSRRRGFRVLAPVAAAVAVGLVALAVVTSGGSNSPDATGNLFAQATAADKSPEATLIAAGPAVGFPIQDGDWRLDSVVADKSYFLGNFTGTATLTYTGKAPTADAAFSVGVYSGDAYVGLLTGTVQGLPSNGHAMVALTSSDAYEPGPYHYAFIDAQ